ncbi:MAG: 2-amino-4-hydroxy-6-hydroxymethyldihydropteridine diphosphokinase [Rhodanobacter sp.]|nr:2-amino-4-hydroxy-6-hydroxymethyldihydropteridine diphosphokinase [Rhodanobacter sp.]
MERAHVALGSNLSDPLRQIHHALDALDRIARTHLLRHSSVYRTAPWGIAEQPVFLNAVAELETALSPHGLLDALLAIERAQGRSRAGPRWGPRTLDLDLLTFGDMQMAQADLHVPHPRIAQRAFVLVPLAELDAGLMIPGLGKVSDLLARVDISGCVRVTF